MEETQQAISEEPKEEVYQGFDILEPTGLFEGYQDFDFLGI